MFDEVVELIKEKRPSDKVYDKVIGGRDSNDYEVGYYNGLRHALKMIKDNLKTTTNELEKIDDIAELDRIF